MFSFIIWCSAHVVSSFLKDYSIKLLISENSSALWLLGSFSNKRLNLVSDALITCCIVHSEKCGVGKKKSKSYN